MPLDVGAARDGHIAHHPERDHPAARHRDALGGDRAHHRSLAQQPRGVILVLDPDVDQHLGQPLEHRAEPGRHRVGVDRDGHPDGPRAGAAHLAQRLSLQQGALGGQPQQRNPGRGRDARLLAHHQNLPDPLLECLDPLTDRRRRHVQAFGRGIETAQLDHRRERRELLGIDRHISYANAT